MTHLVGIVCRILEQQFSAALLRSILYASSTKSRSSYHIHLITKEFYFFYDKALALSNSRTRVGVPIIKYWCVDMLFQYHDLRSLVHQYAALTLYLPLNSAICRAIS